MSIKSYLADDPQPLRTALTCIVSLSVAYVTILWSFRLLRSLRHPLSSNLKKLPSPPGVPILGHSLYIPSAAPWYKFAEWQELYGEIVLIWLLGKPMVILNSVEAARELLERKGANFSGRPPSLYIKEWVGWGDALPFLQYDDHNFRTQKRILKPHLSADAVVKLHHVVYLYAQNLVHDLKESPEQFLLHIQSYFSSILLMAIYGYKPTSSADEKLLGVDAVARTITDADITTQMMVDFFPFLRHIPAWFPGMHAKRVATNGSALRQKMGEKFLADILDSKISGVESSSLVARVLDELDKETGDVVQALKEPQLRSSVMHLGTALYAAGADTSASTVMTFILAMAMHPRVAHKAQEEIDSVLDGISVRLPRFEDRKDLPYTECILKEVLRWNPPAPMGFAHHSKRADEYKGMGVPENASVLANIWSMCHDGSYFSSPDEFIPERHQEQPAQRTKGEINSKACDPKHVVFGFGRRACPGEHLADAVLWCAMVYILATFDILPPIDPVSGEVLTLNPQFSTGLGRRPERFSCRIIPRCSAQANPK